MKLTIVSADSEPQRREQVEPHVQPFHHEIAQIDTENRDHTRKFRRGGDGQLEIREECARGEPDEQRGDDGDHIYSFRSEEANGVKSALPARKSAALTVVRIHIRP